MLVNDAARAARNASEGKVIYPVVVEGGKESVQEKADGKGNLQELAAIVASSATAAAIAASQRHIAKVSSSTLSLFCMSHELLQFLLKLTSRCYRVVHRDSHSWFGSEMHNLMSFIGLPCHATHTRKLKATDTQQAKPNQKVHS